MRKQKLTSITIASLLVLSTLMVTYMPIVKSGGFTESASQKFYGTVEPQTVEGAYPYPKPEFQFNVTCNTTVSVTKVTFTLPTNWVYVSASNSSAWDVTDSGTGYVIYENKTAGEALEDGDWALFNITVEVRLETGTWTIECFDATPTSLGTATVDVYVTPWFNATITPDLEVADKTLWFEIKVTNNASESSINKVEVVHPYSDGWELLDYTGPTGWMGTYASGTHKATFTAPSGSEIAKGSYAIFRFKMTTGTPSSTEDYDWSITCTNTLSGIAQTTLKVKIDDTPPIITIDAPSGIDSYSVGSGNYIWLNITVSDDVKMSPSVNLNTSDFTLVSSGYVTATTYNYAFYYRNNTFIPDGPLAINVTASDHVGNDATPSIAETTVDNTPPFIWIDIGPDSTQVGSTFWIGKTLTSIWINVTVANYELESIGPLTGIYINETRQSGWTFDSTSKNYTGYPMWESNQTLTLNTADKYWIVYVNVTDKAMPLNHTSEMTVYIERDYVPPYEIGFTSATPIYGGLVIHGLYANDLVGVNDYVFERNGTDPTIILQTELDSTSWTGNAFNGVVVLDLTAYAGENVNITVYARDYGANEGDEIVVYAGPIAEGEWCSVELYKGWNLFSLPLIPRSTARADILSLVLKQGAAGVNVVYGYDTATDSWIINPAVMTDGLGYWVNMKAYDVLIVEGRQLPPPPALPPTYYLTEGWVLAGFKCIEPMSVGEYLLSLEADTYFEYIYIWDAENQNWLMLDSGDTLQPGQGFWIWMYEDQYLIPPLP